MLTFDAVHTPQETTFGEPPDVVEIGETDEWWVCAVRSKGIVEITSKLSEKTIMTVKRDDCYGDKPAGAMVLSEGMLTGARRAFELGNASGRS